MVDALIHRRWLYAHLLSTSIVLFAWLTPSSAALLKDIRIGEYDNFTRVVFESTTDLTTEGITASAPGQLTIVFADTQPALVRKIPLDRSHLIQHLKIISQKGRLSITLHFSRRYVRFDTFGLKTPPRVVLDVFWQTPTGQSESQSPQPKPTDIADTSEQSSSEPLSTAESTTSRLPTPQDQAPLSLSADETKIPLRDETIASAHNESGASDPQSAKIQQSEVQKPTAQQQMSSSSAVSPDSVDGKHSSYSAWLQYYLIIALVIITIGILLLLVFMLVSRHRWGSEKGLLKKDEYLHHQDKRIASINARVQEQLKRYDEV